VVTLSCNWNCLELHGLQLTTCTKLFLCNDISKIEKVQLRINTKMNFEVVPKLSINLRTSSEWWRILEVLFVCKYTLSVQDFKFIFLNSKQTFSGWTTRRSSTRSELRSRCTTSGGTTSGRSWKGRRRWKRSKADQTFKSFKMFKTETKNRSNVYMSCTLALKHKKLSLGRT